MHKRGAKLDWSAVLAVRPLCQILDDAVRDYVDHIALDFLGKTYTYRQVGDLVLGTYVFNVEAEVVDDAEVGVV